MYIIVQIDDGTYITKSRLVIWNRPGNDVSGIVARSDKLVKTSEKVDLQPLEMILMSTDHWYLCYATAVTIIGYATIISFQTLSFLQLFQLLSWTTIHAVFTFL